MVLTMDPSNGPSDFFINLCVSGTMVPLTRSELQQFFQVQYAATNLIPDDTPEVAEQLRRGQQFYEHNKDPATDHARQRNREKAAFIPPAGVESIPEFLYLNPIEINGTPQAGLFTSKELPANTWIGTYTGKLLPANLLVQSLFSVLFEDPDAGVTLQIDARHHGNHIRFMNHSDQPNVQPEYLFHQGMYYIAMKTLSEVGAHQQLAYNYSSQYWEKLGVIPAAI